MKKWSDSTRRRIHGFEDVDDSGVVVGVKYGDRQRRPSLWASADFPTQSYGGMTVVRYQWGKINVMLVGARISH